MNTKMKIVFALLPMCASVVMADAITVPVVQHEATFPQHFNFRSDVYAQLRKHSGEGTIPVFLSLPRSKDSPMFAKPTPGNRPHQFNFHSDVYVQTQASK